MTKYYSDADREVHMWLSEYIFDLKIKKNFYDSAFLCDEACI